MTPAIPDDDILEKTPPPADVRLTYGSDPSQFGDLRLPKTSKPSPVVMNIHGGFWRAKYGLAHVLVGRGRSRNTLCPTASRPTRVTVP